MKHSLVFSVLSSGLMLFAALSNDQAKAEMLHTMPHGTYECALPGDAASAAWNTIPEAGFRIGRASSYRNAEGRGTYLLEGDLFTFTRGPLKGRQLLRTATNELTQINPDGKTGKLTCIRVTSGR